MSAGVLAGAAALAFYAYARQRACGVAGAADPQWPIETHTNLEHAPNTWAEALYLAKEALRLAYVETFGRWHTADLFFGLAYLSQRDNSDYVAADIAAKAIPVSSDLSLTQSYELLESLKEVRRHLIYCQGMKLKQAELQFKHWQQHLVIERSDIVVQQATAGLFRPAHLIVRDRTLRQVILCVRGTTSMKDLFTSLSGAVKPHHMVRNNRVVLGYSHLGMLAAARWLLKQVTPTLKRALKDNPGYTLKVVGHSMGGGTAAMATMMMRESIPELADATCLAVACPACMTLELAHCCRDYVTTLVNGTDIVPTFCSGSIDVLREDVTQSSWYAEFQRDLRARAYRALEGSMATVGSATQWTTQNILLPAASPFKSCYSAGMPGQQPGDGSGRAVADSLPGDVLRQPLLQQSGPSGHSLDAESMQHAMVHMAAAAAAAAAAGAGPGRAQEVMAPGIASAERGPSTSLPAIIMPTDTAAAAAAAGPGSALRRRPYTGLTMGGMAAEPAAPDSPSSSSMDGSPSTAAGSTSWKALGSRISSIGLQTGQAVGQSSVRAGSWLFRGVFNVCTAPRRPGMAATTGASAAGVASASGAPLRGNSSAALHSIGSRASLPELQLQQLQHSSDDSSSDDDEEEESSAGAAGAEGRNSQCVQMGITAVVAAVTTDSTSRRAQEQASAAETVLHEVDGHDSSHTGMPSLPERLAASAANASSNRPSDQGAALRAKRKLYPVGRILHLLPADVVARAQQAARDAAGSPASPRQAAASGSNSSSLPRSGSEAARQGASSEHSTSSSSGAATATATGPGGDTSSPGQGSSGSVQPQVQQYLLMEVPDPSSYGRVKLCRSMVMDHFIPSYIKAMDTVMLGLEGRLGLQGPSPGAW